MRPTVFLFGDFQKLIEDIVVSRAGEQGSKLFQEACSQAGQLLTMARGLKQSGEAVHIVHIVVDGRAGEPHDKSLYVTLPDERQEDPSSSRSALRSIKEQFESRYKGDIGILDAVKPIDDEIVMGRPTANPFFDTTLAQDLRALKAEHLVVCGVATSGIVLASVQGANERGMAVTVAEDGCMDFGEMHTHVMHYLAKRSNIIQVKAIKNSSALLEALM